MTSPRSPGTVRCGRRRRAAGPLSRLTILVGDIPIEITRKRIRHVHLRVHAPDGRVTISAPRSLRLPVVESFAVARLEWIRRKQDCVRSQPREWSPRFEEGESVHLWGRRHTLSVVEREGKEGVSLDNDGITLFIRPRSDVARRATVVHDWQKSILHAALPVLVQKWEQRLKVRLTACHLRRMNSRWGTCNHRTGHIRLNTELVTKPAHLLEYVLVHELVHLIVPNHGTRFVALMNEHYPSWRAARAELSASLSAAD